MKISKSVKILAGAFGMIALSMGLFSFPVKAQDISEDALMIYEEATQSDADYFEEETEENVDIVSSGSISSVDISIIEINNEHIFGAAVTDKSVGDLEYRWIACKSGDTNWFEISPWILNNEYLDWIPAESGTYTVCAEVRKNGETEAVQAFENVEFHKYIKSKCQMPNPGEAGGVLIGFETKENPYQSYSYEMLILDCTLYAQGLPAWTYSTGPCGVAEGNAFWTVWQPEYGYYWTLFRLYDSNGNMIDEACYGFENVVVKEPEVDTYLQDTLNIIIVTNDNDHIVAGVAADKNLGDLEYRWLACKNGETDWKEVSPWVLNYEYLDWKPDETGTYTICAEVRRKGSVDYAQAFAGVEYHKYIKNICQMPNTGEEGGVLIGFETTENKNQSFAYEMLVLDCNLYEQGLPAWIYSTGPCGVAEGSSFWTLWNPEYGYYWTLFRLYDSNGNMIDEACYSFDNVEEIDPDLPKSEHGWVECNGKYYYFDRTTGVLQRGGSSCGIDLNEDGSAVMTGYANEKIPMMIRAKQIVDSICDPGDSLATKQEKCYQYVAKFPYLLKDYPVGNFIGNWNCLDAHYANNILNGYGDQDALGAECVGEAAALAYLYAELNFGDVYLYISPIHGWVYAGGRYWDPLFVESKGRKYYNASSYEAAPTYSYKIN